MAQQNFLVPYLDSSFLMNKELNIIRMYYVPIIPITSDVLEHKWRASLKTILFYMNDFDF